MSSSPPHVYNDLDGYYHIQTFHEYLPNPRSQSEPYEHEATVDLHAFGGGSPYHPSPRPSVDQYSETYSTPNSQMMNLEGHVVVTQELYPSHSSISQVLTVQPIETNPYMGGYYYPQPSQASTPPPPMPDTPEHSGPIWDGPADLIDPYFQVVNSKELRTNETLPKRMLIPFLKKICWPQSTKGRGSRHGAQGYICRWPGCEKELARRDHGTTHIAGHFGSKPFPCGICDRRFLRIADRRRHHKMSCDKREMSNISVYSGVSSGSNGSNGSNGSSSSTTTSGSGYGEEPVQPSHYTNSIEKQSTYLDPFVHAPLDGMSME